MHQVLLACTIEYNARVLSALSVWNPNSDFEIKCTVYDGNEALLQLRNSSYDLVITELDIHGVDGLHLLRSVREEELCPLVVILSDTVEFAYVRESLMFGAFDYIQKMPDARTMRELLNRADEELAAKSRLDDVRRVGYPVPETESLVSGILRGHSESEKLFLQTFDDIYRIRRDKEHSQQDASQRDIVFREDSLESDILVKEFYQNIIHQVFKAAPWLHLYVSITHFQQLDYLWAGTLDGFREYFSRRLRELQEWVCGLCPQTEDRCLQQLILYVLEHPEGDLRLKTIAEQVHLNYSYLSAHFSEKMPFHFSEYVLRVKMARAAFLLESTDLLIYEICDLLSYQDTNYFTRQFRKIYQMTPTAYREEHRAGISAMDYSYL